MSLALQVSMCRLFKGALGNNSHVLINDQSQYDSSSGDHENFYKKKRRRRKYNDMSFLSW